MRKYAIAATVFSTVVILALPFAGGAGPSLLSAGASDSGSNLTSGAPLGSSTPLPDITPSTAVPMANGYQGGDQAIEAQAAADAAAQTKDWEHLAQKPVPKPLPPVSESGAASGTNERRASLEAQGLSCPGYSSGSTSGAPGAVSALGVPGTTSDDLASFAAQYNSIREANCLEPISYFFYDSCMEARLFWMAESPSPDPSDGWGHIGSTRIDGVPSVGCDGNLAGGSGNTGATVASKWWESSSHRAALYRPDSSVAGACIAFAMTHGGIDEPYSFTRAAARWTSC